MGHEFADPGLLSQALTHRSWCAENDGVPSNERLELLGDAVLGLVVAEHAYARYPEMAEGELAKTRSAVVRASTLVDVAEGVDLGAELLVGRGEEITGGRSKPSILADAMEAVIGAVFLDAGYPAARVVVLGLFADLIDEAAAQGPGEADFKTRFQELTVQVFEDLPDYSVTADGPEHERRFSATVSVGGKVLGEGTGTSKKGAEQAAARTAYRSLEKSHRPGEGERQVREQVGEDARDA